MKLYIISYFIIISFISCAPIYIPNDVNAPLLTKEGEATLSLNYGTNGFNYQSAYALTNNLAFQINGQNLAQDINSRNKESINVNEPEQTVNYYEAAFGYYYPFNETTILEIFTGGGIGNSSALDTYNIFTKNKIYAEGEFYKMFLQLDIGNKREFIEGGVALRFAYIEFTKYKFENFKFTGKPSSILFEPTVFLRLGGPIFKFKTQLGFASKLSKEEFVMYQSISVSFGFIIRINTL